MIKNKVLLEWSVKVVFAPFTGTFRWKQIMGCDKDSSEGEAGGR